MKVSHRLEKYSKIWKKVLEANEEVKYEFSIGKKYRSLAIIIIGILTLFVLLSGIFLSFKVKWLGYTVIGIGVLVFLSALFYFGWYLKIANLYAFTNKRVLIHQGWLSTKLISIDYDKITDVSVIEPFWERIITNTGFFIINTAGTSSREVILAHVENPYEVKKQLDSWKSKTRMRDF